MTDRAEKPKAVAEIERPACIGCEQCLPVCPTDAITMDADGVAVVDADACSGCGKCVEACPSSAIAMSGGGTPAAESVAAPSGSRPSPEPEREAALTVGAGPAGEVWVFVEHTDGRPAPVSWELLGEAAELARDLGGRVCAAILGHQTDHLVKEAAAYGAQTTYVIDDPVLAHYRTDPYLRGLVGLIEQHRPEILLLGATTMGRDLAGAVATSLRTGLTADCTGLSIDPESRLLEQTRPAYGGNIMATILCEKRRPQMATVRPRVMEMPPRDDAGATKIVRGELGLTESDILLQVIEYAREADSSGVRIEDADILVSGGRGLGGPEGFKMLAELADALGGVVSGSRAAVDQGWIEQPRQVGQTGKTVRPKLYLACGISGAIQHLVGMETSDIIVAINRDPNAPIFNVATYGLVGDVNDIVPALTRVVKTRLSGRGQSHE
jgi:electron transfer flavoprotein alpha subunit